jgi:hypothetical protein
VKGADDRPNLFWRVAVVFWLFPIVLGSAALIAVSLVRGGAGWRERDPDPPSAAGR